MNQSNSKDPRRWEKPEIEYGDPDRWETVRWPKLEELSRLGCQCGHCESPQFTRENPMELAVKCHVGAPLWVAYWDGWMYYSCAECGRPVCKVEVSKKLID